MLSQLIFDIFPYYFHNFSFLRVKNLCDEEIINDYCKIVPIHKNYFGH